MAAAAILVFGFHFRFLGIRCIVSRGTIAESFMKIGSSLPKLLHFLCRFVYNGNSLFRPKIWWFGGKWLPKRMHNSNFTPGGLFVHQIASNEPLAMKIAWRFLVVIWYEGKRKKRRKLPQKRYISPYCPDDAREPIWTKLGLIGYIREAIKCAKFDVDRCKGVRATEGQSWGSPLWNVHGL